MDEIDGSRAGVAADVTAQVEFNAMEVGSYRLIGSRIDGPQAEGADEQGAGETVFSGQSITVLYEIVPREPGYPAQFNAFRPSSRPVYWSGNQTGELFTVILDYELDRRTSRESLSVPLIDDGLEFAAASPDFKFAAAVAGFGLLLQDSPFKGQLDYVELQRLVSQSVPPMRGGHTGLLLDLVTKARTLAERGR